MDFSYYQIPEDRNLRILDVVIRLYTERAEPVSSAAVSRDLKHCWSSATIRKVFSELEELGWLAQPHPSSGRVPTDLGYRIYVEQVVQASRGESKLERWLESELNVKGATLREALDSAVQMLSRLSHTLGMSLLIQLPTAPVGETAEAGVQITGIGELLDQPEFEDPHRLRVLIHLLEDASPVEAYLLSLASHPGQVQLRIGAENTLADLSGFSLATTRIDRRGETGFLGILGPVRMEYPLILAAMNNIVRLLHAGSSRQSWS